MSASSAIITVVPVMKLASCVREPTTSASAVRVKEPVTGMALNSAAIRLQKPSAHSSWLGFGGA